eukprot:530645-Ditylum_brightwellii.AAC.1
MGFNNNQANIATLVQTHRNVNHAMDMLLTNPPATIVQKAIQLNSNVTELATMPSESQPMKQSKPEHATQKDATEKKND